MAYANEMTKLLNKIERRLGTRPLNLPEGLRKDDWVQVIDEETLDTFSRYIPHSFTITLGPNNKKGQYYLLDERIIPGNVTIIGVRDIKWDQFGNAVASASNAYGFYDMYNGDYGFEDVASIQMRADSLSLFNNGIFLEFEAPNKVKLSSSTGVYSNIITFPIELLLKHPITLSTISPTKMETLEALAVADIASFLYEELKYYDNLESVFGNIDLKLDDIKVKADERETIVTALKESYVSAGNDKQPMIYTI